MDYADWGLAPRVRQSRVCRGEAIGMAGRALTFRDERRAVRQAPAGPPLEDLRDWLLNTTRRWSKKSDAVAVVAIRYTLSRWEAHCRYRSAILGGRVQLAA